MKREPEHVITVGPVPGRKGWWLGHLPAADPGVWVALAKFRSEEAAEEFLRISQSAGWTSGDTAKP